MYKAFKLNIVLSGKIFMCLLVFLSACDSVSSVGNNRVRKASSSLAINDTPSESVIVTFTPSLIKALGNLQISSFSRFKSSCSPDAYSMSPSALVLASSRLDYTHSEIRQIQNYINSPITSGQGGLTYNLNYNNQLIPPLPSSLLFMQGALIGQIYSWNIQSGECNALFQLTNTGTTPLQLTKVSMQFTASPQQNNAQYRLINTCMQGTKYDHALLPECPSYPAGSSSNYLAEVHLGMATVNTEVRAAFSPFIIQPGETQLLAINMQSQTNLIYSVSPQFTFGSGGEQQQIRLAPITVAFARANQFSCYELRGTHFVQLPKVVSSGKSSDFYHDNNISCV